MEVIFVDVGFGSCNVILTGSGEAILIDAGERLKEPLAVLRHFSVKRIRHLIVSHWHDDHVGGATGILRAFSGKIGSIWFPADPSFKGTEFWRALVEEADTGGVSQDRVEALMVRGKGARRVWSSAPLDADLTIVSPCFMEANRGVAAGDTNGTCGILVLRVGTRFIVFAGDATLKQWEEVPQRAAVPITAEVLAVPHHAGIMWPAHWKSPQVQTALANLYSRLVRPRVAIISAATRPGEKHPREDVVRALTQAGCRVMCTQMTKRCSSNLEVARKLQTSVPLAAPGRSSKTEFKTQAGNSRDVACAGSVIVELQASGAIIHQLAPHQQFVNRLPNPAGSLPLCRR